MQKIMPGGVSSPVRAFKSVGGSPIVFDSVKVRLLFDCFQIRFWEIVVVRECHSVACGCPHFPKTAQVDSNIVSCAPISCGKICRCIIMSDDVHFTEYVTHKANLHFVPFWKNPWTG